MYSAMIELYLELLLSPNLMLHTTIIIPVSNESSAAVAVWGAMSLLLQVTLELAVTVLGLTCCAAAPCGIVIIVETEILEGGVEVDERDEDGSCCCCCVLV